MMHKFLIAIQLMLLSPTLHYAQGGTNWISYNPWPEADFPFMDGSKIAFDSNNQPWVTGVDCGGFNPDQLATFENGVWTTQPVGVGFLCSYTSMEFDQNDHLWLASDIGVTEFYNDTIVNYDNPYTSGIPCTLVDFLMVDNFNTKWIACHEFFTYEKVVSSFDGINWVSYTSDVTGIPDSSWVTGMTADADNNIYIATTKTGVYKFDGTNWTNINTSNSNLLSNWVSDFRTDAAGNVWTIVLADTASLLAKFDGVMFTYFNPPDYSGQVVAIYNFDIDNNGTFWIRPNNPDLAKFDGINWSYFNGPVFSDYNRNIRVDDAYNVWLVGESFDHPPIIVFNELDIATQTTSIEADSQFDIYPTLVTDLVTIENKSTGRYDVVISNMMGVQQYSEESISDQNYQLPTSNLQNGMFILSIIENGKVVSRKKIMKV